MASERAVWWMQDWRMANGIPPSAATAHLADRIDLAREEAKAEERERIEREVKAAFPHDTPWVIRDVLAIVRGEGGDDANR